MALIINELTINDLEDFANFDSGETLEKDKKIKKVAISDFYLWDNDMPEDITPFIDEGKLSKGAGVTDGLEIRRIVELVK